VAGLEAVEDVLGDERPGEQEALGLLAAEAAQVAHLVGGLHTFGDGAQVEAVAEADDGGGERLGQATRNVTKAIHGVEPQRA